MGINDMVRAVILPGNGGNEYPAPLRGNFYDDLAKRLEESKLFSEVVATSMPDACAARRSIWIPHLVDTIGVSEDTIVIGHSSGAEACMRLAEDTKLYGIIWLLHAILTRRCWRACLGVVPTIRRRLALGKNEKQHAVQDQFHSDDDCFIPVS